MNQRYSLLKAGYCANVPALYYNRVQLCDQFAPAADERVKQAVGQFAEMNKKGLEEAAGLMRKVAEIAAFFEIQAPELPASPEQFFNWLPACVEAFENSFPMSRIDHYYFLFGRKCAELYVNFEMACTCISLDLSVDRSLDLNRKIEKYLRDNEYILFKLIAPAALLSSEHRQNFFNVFYRKMNASFELYRGVEVAELGQGELRRLHDGLSTFSNDVKSGYEGCLAAMNDLGV